MSKIGGIVEMILAKSTEARDSDNVLIIEYLNDWKNAGFTPHQIQLIKDTNFESITRCRRKLQEGGKFLPSPEVAAQRRLKSYVVQQNIPNTDATDVPDLIRRAR